MVGMQPARIGLIAQRLRALSLNKAEDPPQFYGENTMSAPELSPVLEAGNKHRVSISETLCTSFSDGKPTGSISSTPRAPESADMSTESNESRATENIPPSKTTNVQRGFGGLKIDTTGVFNDKIPCYPPPSNAYYQHSMHPTANGHTMTFVPSIDATVLAPQSIAYNAQERVRTKGEKNKLTIGEIEAQKIDWTRVTYSDEGHGRLIFGDIAPCREEFVNMINDAISQGKWPYNMCTVCGKQHIPWGAPIHLQDRDSCYSMLPEWFPADDFEKPWDTFRSLINHIVKIKERERDRLANPIKKPWDLEYHEPSPAWKAVGRNGGWWKCRTGDSAPMTERMCKLCHRPQADEEQAREELPAKEKMLLDAATKWIDELEMRQMRKDMDICNERFRGQGHY